MKWYVFVMSTIPIAWASEVHAQASVEPPFLVKAIDYVTGKPINPIGADSEPKAKEQVEHLQRLMHETNALLPGYSRVWYDPNPKFGQAPLPQQPSPRNDSGPSAVVLDQRGLLKNKPSGPNTNHSRNTIFDIKNRVVPNLDLNRKPASPPTSGNAPAVAPTPYNMPTPTPSAAPFTPLPLTKASQPKPVGRGYGYDEGLAKTPAPKGVAMRIGIDRGTLQRVAAPPALVANIRADKE